MRVLLTAGGWSNEREVSLVGAKAVHEALESLGHEVTLFDPAESLDDLTDLVARHEFAFFNLHGCPGEDGLLQAFFDRVGLPYQGAGPASSFLALRKSFSKMLFRSAGIKTPNWELLTAMPSADWKPKLFFPLFVKPDAGGSSLGMGLAKNMAELREALGAAFAEGREVIIEEAVTGSEVSEVTCAILGDEVLPLIEIRPPEDAVFFDYDSKYVPGKTQEICPAPIPEDTAEIIREASRRAHEALGLSVYSRSDFMVKDGEPSLLEVNTLPGMTPTSLLPQAAAEAGYSFSDLVAKLIELGMAEKR
jgi:D-alanine-D-alanine ligase